MYIIQLFIHPDSASEITELADMFHTQSNGTLEIFYSREEAAAYRRENYLDGKIIEILVDE